MRFEINPSDAVPIYRQIVEQVRRQVASGQLRTGDELPSVRTLALEQAINPMTVSKAYNQLEAEGLLERRRGLGMVVADIKPTSRPSQRLILLEPTLQAAAQQAAQLGLSTTEALALFERCLKQHSGAKSP
ncbi:MAG: GntR family transcriptional regulator [Burkholderiales bacterium]